MMGYPTLPRTLELEPQNQIQFSLILMKSLFSGSLPFYRGYNQYILSPVNLMVESTDENEALSWHPLLYI